MPEWNWGFLALGGLLVAVAGNALRALRTGNAGCLGHLFVRAQEMTGAERVLNRSGVALFLLGAVFAVAL